MKRKIRGMILIALGLVLTISAAVIFAGYEEQAELAGENAAILLEELTVEIQRQEEEAIYDPAVEEALPVAEMPRLTLGGYDLVGIIYAPSLDLRLPVLDSWDYDLLQLAPCRYSGSVEGGDLILLGHNYKRHFGPLRKLETGDAVEFCDVKGTVYTYEVKAKEVLEKTELERLTATDHDLTIFTCTNGGYSRLVIRCDLVSSSSEPIQDLPDGVEIA